MTNSKISYCVRVTSCMRSCTRTRVKCKTRLWRSVHEKVINTVTTEAYISPKRNSVERCTNSTVSILNDDISPHTINTTISSCSVTHCEDTTTGGMIYDDVTNRNSSGVKKSEKDFINGSTDTTTTVDCQIANCNVVSGDVYDTV